MGKLENYDASTCALAATVFSDEHYGSALTEEEFEYRTKLEEAYKQEIEEARAIVSTNPNFNSMTYEDKIVYCIELLGKLRAKNKKEADVEIDITPRENVNYADMNDLFDNIPQEPYEEIEKSSPRYK